MRHDAPVTDNDRPSTEQVTVLLGQDDDALLALLAEQVASGIGPLDRDRLIALGKAWFRGHLEELRAAVCHDAGLREALHHAGLTPEVVAALSDALAAAYGHPTATTLAVLLLRYGVEKLCG